VLGAGSGAGLAVVDTARAMGLRVIAAASTADKRALAQRYDAEAVIDTSGEDLKTRAREISGGGVDIVFDPVGGTLSEQGVRSLAMHGRHLVVGFAAGEIARLPLNLVLLGNRHIIGVDWGGWSKQNPEADLALLADVRDAVQRGEVDPIAPKEYAFADVGRALAEQLERRVTGKAALIM